MATAAFWPTALNRWVLPKDVVLGVAALVAVWVVPRGRLPRWVLVVVVAAVAVLGVAALRSELPLNAILGRWPRYEGITTGFAYLLALWLGARLFGPSATGSERRQFTTVVATLSLIIGVVSVLESLGLRPLSTDLSRPGSLLGNATDQGTIGAVCVLLLALPALRLRAAILSPRGGYILVGLGFGFATVVIAASRASLLALILGLAIVGMREIMGRTNRRRTAIIVATALAGVVALALLSPTLGPRLLGSSEFGSSTIGDRVIMWSESLRLWLLQPWLGAGPNGFADAIARIHDAAWFNTVGQSITLDSPHNILVQALVAGGPLLLLGFIAAVALTARAAVTKALAPPAPPAPSGADFQPPAAFPHPTSADFATSSSVALLAILVVLLTHVTSPGTVVLGAFLAGMLVAVVATPTLPPRLPLPLPLPLPRRWTRSLLAGTIVCWLAFVATGLAAEVSLSDGRRAAFAGDVGSATASFERASALRPWDVDTTITAAESLTARLDKGDSDALAPAVWWANRALEQAPRSLTAAQASVTAALAAGELVGARTTLERFRGLMPQQPWIVHRLAVVMLLEGDLAGAEQNLVLAISLNETNADPWLTLAYLYGEQGRLTEAANATAMADSLTP